MVYRISKDFECIRRFTKVMESSNTGGGKNQSVYKTAIILYSLNSLNVINLKYYHVHIDYNNRQAGTVIGQKPKP